MLGSRTSGADSHPPPGGPRSETVPANVLISVWLMELLWEGKSTSRGLISNAARWATHGERANLQRSPIEMKMKKEVRFCWSLSRSPWRWRSAVLWVPVCLSACPRLTSIRKWPRDLKQNVPFFWMQPLTISPRPALLNTVQKFASYPLNQLGILSWISSRGRVEWRHIQDS